MPSSYSTDMKQWIKTVIREERPRTTNKIQKEKEEKEEEEETGKLIVLSFY